MRNENYININIAAIFCNDRIDNCNIHDEYLD